MFTTKSVITWSNNILEFIDINGSIIDNEMESLIDTGKTNGIQFGYIDGTNFIGVRHWIDKDSANNWINLIMKLGGSSYISSAKIEDL